MPVAPGGHPTPHGGVTVGDEDGLLVGGEDGLLVVGDDVGVLVVGEVGIAVVGVAVGIAVVGVALHPAVLLTSATTASLHCPFISAFATQKNAPPLHANCPLLVVLRSAMT